MALRFEKFLLLSDVIVSIKSSRSPSNSIVFYSTHRTPLFLTQAILSIPLVLSYMVSNTFLYELYQWLNQFLNL